MPELRLQKTRDANRELNREAYQTMERPFDVSPSELEWPGKPQTTSEVWYGDPPTEAEGPQTVAEQTYRARCLREDQ